MNPLPHTKHPEFKKLFLYNLDGDYQPGGRISKGDLVQGQKGYVAAEQSCSGWTVRTVLFLPNRQCKWKGFILPCMAHPSAPAGQSRRPALRPYNYVVAAASKAVALQAKNAGFSSVITPKEQRVVNLEISTFGEQGPASSRRATLL
jgi:hypothetical protein